MNETKPPELDDATLVARAKNGDVDAYGLLYQRYVEPIFRYLFIRSGNRQDAEDLVEDVFLRSFQALDRYRESGRLFSAFLFQVAKNALTDHYRSDRKEVDLSESESMAASLLHLDDHVIQEEQLRNVRQALDDLPPNYREVIILRVILGQSTAVVSQWMNQTQGATRVMLFRALEAVRRRLKDKHEERS